MKKIVSVLSVAALTLSAVFAVDVSISYQTRGTIYDETTTHTYNAGTVTSTQTRNSLDQLGYDSAEGDLAFSAKNDFAGFALTTKPNAGTQNSAFNLSGTTVDTYYGWMNFGNIQLTTGLWDGRYVALFDGESSNWGDNEYARYKPGVIGGKIGFDVDNLTTVYTGSGAALSSSSRFGNFKAINKSKKVSTAIAYTNRKDDESYFMIKGVLVDSDWGSTLRTDKDRAWDTTKGYEVGNAELNFFSGFAGEFAFRTPTLDLNFVAKSLKRDELALAAFVRTIGEKSSLLFGLTAGLDLQSTKVGGEKAFEHRAREFAFDFRGHFQLSEDLCLTTMNNLSVLDQEKPKDQKYDKTDFHLWDMVSVAYKVNETLLAQLTGEAECDLLHMEQSQSDADKTELYGPSACGGFKITVTPGVKYSFNENATLTAGVALEWNNVGVSRAVSEPETGTYNTVSTVKVPVIFKVAL